MNLSVILNYEVFANQCTPLFYENCRDISSHNRCPNDFVKIIDGFSNLGNSVERHLIRFVEIYRDMIRRSYPAQDIGAHLYVESKDDI